jgi:hypothetical protein
MVNFGEKIEPAFARHLEIEKKQVGRQILDRVERVLGARAFSHHTSSISRCALSRRFSSSRIRRSSSTIDAFTMMGER